MQSYQQSFWRDWEHLHDAHVRSLAWLLTSPFLLETGVKQWAGVNLAPALQSSDSVVQYLNDLDACPDTLHQMLLHKPVRRLGLYAEILFSHYLQHFFSSVEHGRQIQDDDGRTIGEFDFLVAQEQQLTHWELATKFYLLSNTQWRHSAVSLGDYLGPNLSDSLVAKMDKMVGHQLRLGANPVAQSQLPLPVACSQAFIKGWLFYWPDQVHIVIPVGIAKEHCRGEIWTLSDMRNTESCNGILLDRLEWLAPARCHSSQLKSVSELVADLELHFMKTDVPVLLAQMVCDENSGIDAKEIRRAMIVPDDWLQRARMIRRIH